MDVVCMGLHGKCVYRFLCLWWIEVPNPPTSIDVRSAQRKQKSRQIDWPLQAWCSVRPLFISEHKWYFTSSFRSPIKWAPTQYTHNKSPNQTERTKKKGNEEKMPHGSRLTANPFEREFCVSIRECRAIRDGMVGRKHSARQLQSNFIAEILCSIRFKTEKHHSLRFTSLALHRLLRSECVLGVRIYSISFHSMMDEKWFVCVFDRLCMWAGKANKREKKRLNLRWLLEQENARVCAPDVASAHHRSKWEIAKALTHSLTHTSALFVQHTCTQLCTAHSHVPLKHDWEIYSPIISSFFCSFVFLFTHCIDVGSFPLAHSFRFAICLIRFHHVWASTHERSQQQRIHTMAMVLCVLQAGISMRTHPKPNGAVAVAAAAAAVGNKTEETRYSSAISTILLNWCFLRLCRVRPSMYWPFSCCCCCCFFRICVLLVSFVHIGMVNGSSRSGGRTGDATQARQHVLCPHAHGSRIRLAVQEKRDHLIFLF